MSIELAQREVNDKRNRETDEPGVIVEPDKKCRDRIRRHGVHGDEEPGKIRSDRDKQRYDRNETEPVCVTILAVEPIKRADVQLPAPPDVVIGDHDSADWA